MNAQMYREHLRTHEEDLATLEALLEAVGVPTEAREYQSLLCGAKVGVTFYTQPGHLRISVEVVETVPAGPEPFFWVDIARNSLRRLSLPAAVEALQDHMLPVNP